MEELLNYSLIAIIIGLFTFLGCGFSIANSIEAKESEKTKNALFIIMVIGIGFFVLGTISLIASYLYITFKN